MTATRWVVYDEDELKDSGQLKGTTFEKFKSAHSDPVQVDATQDEIDLIAKATGIQSSAIKLVCYERPQFVESQKKGFGLTDILQILLAVLIFALLGYVVFRSTRKQKVEEPEPELSVDALLAATSPTITICTFLTLTNGFKLFDQNFALTGGNPAKMSQLLALNIYDTMYGTTGWQGVGQAKAVIFFILVAVIALIQNKLTTSKEVQD